MSGESSIIGLTEILNNWHACAASLLMMDMGAIPVGKSSNDERDRLTRELVNYQRRYERWWLENKPVGGTPETTDSFRKLAEMTWTPTPETRIYEKLIECRKLVYMLKILPTNPAPDEPKPTSDWFVSCDPAAQPRLWDYLKIASSVKEYPTEIELRPHDDLTRYVNELNAFMKHHPEKGFKFSGRGGTMKVIPLK